MGAAPSRSTGSQPRESPPAAYACVRRTEGAAGAARMGVLSYRSVVSAGLAVLSMAAAGAPAPSPAPLQRCSTAGRTLYGDGLFNVPEGKPPKAVRGPRPRLPERQNGSCSGSALHEVLIDPKGKVRRVWVVSEPTCEPPWPALNQAILKGIQEAEYQPAVLDGRRVAACAMISTLIHWR
jgi:hypothetical protein